MLRKFLSDEEKAELDDRCRRYSQWRQSIALEEEEEEYARDHVNLNAQEMTKPSLRMGKTTDVRPGKTETSEIATDGEVVEVPENVSDEQKQKLNRPLTFAAPNRTSDDTNSDDTAGSNVRYRVSDASMDAVAAARRASTATKKPRKKILSVDEIFAKGMREWREQQERFQASAFGSGKRQTEKHMKFRGQSGTHTKRESHFVRKEIEREDEERRWKLEIDRSADSLEHTGESLTTSSDEDMELSETEETHSTMTAEQKYRRKMKRNLDIALDVFKLIVIFCLSFLLTIIPVFIIDKDNPPEEVKFNISEKNICYWQGSRGLLDDCNPCPYRGYIGNDMFGSECLRWKDAIDGVPGVGIDNIRYKYGKDAFPDNEDNNGGDWTYVKPSLEKWRKMYYEREQLPEDRRIEITDYEYKYCRRILNGRPKGKTNTPTLALPICLTLGPDEGKKEVYVSPCWIVPCSITVASRCYQNLVEKIQKGECEANPGPWKTMDG